MASARVSPAFLLASATSAVALLAGCSANVAASAEGADAESNGSASLAVVVVERSVSGSSLNGLSLSGSSVGGSSLGGSEALHAPAGGVTARAEAVARFLRTRSGAVEADALRLVGAVLDLPATGTCTPSTGRTAPATAAARVELLDVGPLSLEATLPVQGSPVQGIPAQGIPGADSGAVSGLAGEAAGSAGALGLAPAVTTTTSVTPLLPRRLPDVADLVSGVVYARAVDGEALPARARYVVRSGDGRSGEGRTLLQATAPADVSGVRIAGLDAASRPVLSSALTAQGSVELTWDAGDDRAADDLIYVDIAGASASQRCVFADGGRALLPAGVLPAGDGTLTIHRVRREPLRLTTGEAGELRFDFARTFAFTRS